MPQPAEELDGVLAKPRNRAQMLMDYLLLEEFTQTLNTAVQAAQAAVSTDARSGNTHVARRPLTEKHTAFADSFVKSLFEAR